MSKILKLFKMTSTIILSVVLVLSALTFLYMRQATFGATPSGKHLEQVRQSEHHDGKEFRNLLNTPDLTEGHSYWSVIKDQFFTTHPRLEPTSPIPSMKTDLKELDPAGNYLVWFGHSSYFLQMEGKRILVDPVFSGKASPVPGTVKAFEGTDPYTVDDLPAIDILIISHDHYDHLDYKTIVQLQDKVEIVIAGLGMGAHFKRWGYPENSIAEQDWNQTLAIDHSLSVHTLPARHFSGRGFSRNKSLWASYLLETPKRKIYVGGDSGYGPHFAEIGAQFGTMDLALLDNGQYNEAWREVHLHPEEVIQATRELNAAYLFPVHSSKFVLAMHPWDEPLIRVSELAEEASLPLVSPIIGELVDLDALDRPFTKWWEAIE